MIDSAHCRRLLILTMALGLAFVALGGRLVVLQWVSHDKYRVLAERNTHRTFLRQPRRGDILDRNGNPLATCLPVKKVFADPSVIGEHAWDVASALSPLLEYRTEELAPLLRPQAYLNKRGEMATNQYVRLRRKVSAEQWEKISAVLQQLRFQPPGQKLTAAQLRYYRTFRRYALSAEDDQHRFYPSKALASHVLGFAQDKEEDFNNVAVSDLEGRDGIELTFDSKLRGLQGWRVTATDVTRREIVSHRAEEVEARPGLDVVLTLDMVVQKIVEDELAVAVKDNRPLSASAMVVQPSSGAILAMATWPNYDPNQPGMGSIEDRRNRIITDHMEPGSTFKIVAVAAALDEGVVGLHDTFDCEQGRWLFRGRYLSDHEAYGTLSVEDILVKSSNIGTAKIAIKLGENRFYEYMRAFGFDSRSGIPLPGEATGKVHPVKRWDKLMISRIPMGQAVAVTHLQMMMAMSAMANRGRLMRPMLIERLQQQDGSVYAQYHPQAVRQVVREQTALEIVAALKRVVSGEGTAAKANLDHYTVAGKTGTAEKPGPGGYLEDKYIASFIGFFPADAPEVCISVVLDEPRGGYYGGQKAAPVFKRIAEQVAQYLKIRPDREEFGPDPLTTDSAPQAIKTAAMPSY